MYQYQQPYQQPYQPQMQPRGVPGRVVSSLSEVTVNDVPSDGSIGYFPARDGSCIWAKQWRGDGSIETVSYLPQPLPKQEKQHDRLDEIMERLDSIEASLKKRKGAKDE